MAGLLVCFAKRFRAAWMLDVSAIAIARFAAREFDRISGKWLRVNEYSLSKYRST